MTNPYEKIDERFDRLESIVKEIKSSLSSHQPDTNPEEIYLTRKEVSQRFKVSIGTIHNLMKSKKLPYSKVGRKTVFKAKEVEKVFDEMRG